MPPISHCNCLLPSSSQCLLALPRFFSPRDNQGRYTMPRFSIGSPVRIIGGIAGDYSGVNPVVVEVIPNGNGLSHFNPYHFLILDQGEDTLYEFQLAPHPNREKTGS